MNEFGNVYICGPIQEGFLAICLIVAELGKVQSMDNINYTIK